jgi:hypothetical protein
MVKFNENKLKTKMLKILINLKEKGWKCKKFQNNIV